MRPLCVLIGLPFCFGVQAACANQALFYKEVNLVGGYSREAHWVGKSEMLENSLGFEDYRTFSSDYGDFLATDLQVRLAYDSMEASEDAWALEVHNAFLEYKPGLGRKIRIGHFDPAFGLEPVVDTHSTLLQTPTDQSVGVKKDWGVAFKGTGSSFDIEGALQLGSGMSVYRRDGSYLATVRLGSIVEGNFQCGLSVLRGRVLETEGMSTFPRNELLSDKAVSEKRVGLDGRYLWGPLQVMTEISYGENDGTPVMGNFWQFDFTIPRHQQWTVQLQYRSWMNDMSQRQDNDDLIGAGVTWKASSTVTMRTALLHDLNRMGGGEDDTLLFQVYFYGR